MPSSVGLAIAGMLSIIAGQPALLGASWLIQTGVSLLVAAVFAPRKPPETMRSTSVTGVDPLAPWQVVYGAPRVGGVITFAALSGPTNAYHHMVITLAAHEVEAIGALYLDDEEVPLDGGGDATGKYAGYVHCEKLTGAPNQATFTGLTDATRPPWLVISGDKQGVRLNGSGHYLDSAANTALRPATLTCELLLRLHALHAGTILSMDGGADWTLECLVGGEIKFTDAAGSSVTSTGALSVQRWTHVAVVAQASGLAIYIDGVADGTDGTAYDGGTGSGVFRVGSLDGASAYFAGDVDNIRVWSVARTPAQIVANQNVEIAGADTGLVGSWNLNEGTGSTGADTSGSGLTLTLQPMWSSAHRQRGRAHVWLRFQWNADLFPHGRPRISFAMQGKRVLDPRTGQDIDSITAGTDKVNIAAHGWIDAQPVRTHSASGTLDSALAEDTTYWLVSTGGGDFSLAAEPGGAAIDLQGDGTGTSTVYPLAYSVNPALVAADYLLDAEVGQRVALADLDLTLLAAAANVCEEAVTLADGGSENRYECHGAFRIEEAPQAVLEALLSAMAGSLAYVGGDWGLYAGAYRTPTVTLTDDDLRGSIKVRPMLGARDNFNAVEGVFASPDNDWEPTPYPPQTNATYETEDGGERIPTELNLPFTASDSMAQRLAKIHLERQRQPIVVTVPCKLSGFLVRPGDTVQLTHARFGWSTKVFDVVQVQLAVDDGGDGPTLGADLTLRETASAVYDWNSGMETELDPAPNTGLPDPFLVFAPGSLTLASGTAYLDVRLDGTIFSRIHASWEAVQDQYVISGGRVELQYKKSADSDWIPGGSVAGAQTFAFVLDVKDGVAYDVRVRSLNRIGSASAWVTSSNHTVIGKTEPPSDVTGFVAQQNGELVTFLWENVTDVDLAGYGIRYAIVGVPWASAKPLQNVLRGTRVTDAAVPPSPENNAGGRDPWQFWIKAVDNSGNESATAAGFQLIVSPPYDAVVQVEQWPLWAGTLTNYVRNPRSGNLNPRSAAGPDATDLFTAYCATPPSSVAYEAPEIDIAYDDECRIWIEDRGKLGPGESGLVDWDEQVDYRLDAGSYGGFESWGAGQATGRYFKGKVVDDPAADGGAVLQRMKVVVDLLEHSETAAIAISANEDDGLEVTFLKQYREVPKPSNLSITPPAGLTPSYHGLSETGVHVWWLDGTGVPQTGTGSYSVTGV